MLKEIFNSVCPEELHPAALAHDKLRQAAAGRVLAGPFAGLRYAQKSIGSAYAPKLLGTYELELHPLIEQLCAGGFPLIVNAGAGEGYYAVGMAVRCPRAKVVAFEGQREGQDLIRQVAEMNGVAERILVEGLCTPENLRRTISADSPCLLIMDVEGAELSLLQPEIVPALESCHVLVELHDFIHPGLSAEIAARFRHSHRIDKIRQRGRGVNDLPFRSRLLDRWLIRLTDEQRPVRMEWWYMQPFGADARDAAGNSSAAMQQSKTTDC